MKAPRDRSIYQLGGRLALLRKERGLSQAEFGKEFAIFCGQSKPLIIPTISSWEQNHRQPTMSTTVQLALFYGVSCDYLFGITDNRDGDASDSKKNNSLLKLSAHDVPIKPNLLINYDGCPVFIKFINSEHLNQWGILNYENKVIRCKDFDVSLTVKLELYPASDFPGVRTRIMNLEQLLATNVVYIKMKTSDPAVEAFYNGRYQHNSSRTFLIKLDNNTPLSYTGLDVCYTAFRG